ncbi:MAG: hypothetical protein AAFW66_14115, partial [Pseudomonadota bacterium]
MLKILKVALAASAIVCGATAMANADDHQVLGELKFLIPGGAGGGWVQAPHGGGADPCCNRRGCAKNGIDSRHSLTRVCR